jgi:3-(methylthio)propanoyl-CoA dehydrogenase
MTPFKAPLDDILFCLEAVSGAPDLPAWDSELVAEILSHFARFAEAEIGPIDAPGDLEGCRLENGRVKGPKTFVTAYQSYATQGWSGLGLPESYGGQGMPGPVVAAVTEMMSGACHALEMFTGLVPGASRTIERFGTPEQREKYIPLLASGLWLPTMCMTEAGAGSDLSGIRTRAVEVDGVWKITGDKIFISGGDHDLSEGILHLVLARTGTLEEGVRGLSLFLCPAMDDAGQRNRIVPTRIEEKMGLHGSPTCQLAFDGADGYLLGNLGDGLRAMFTMMNHARLDVSLQGVAHSDRGFDIAKTYAAERRQGRISGQAGQVSIDHHPDVARMLRKMESLTLGMRAMSYITLVALEAGQTPDLVDFLTPVCKVFCTDNGLLSADMAIQILGGYGYLHEYRVEQNLRDLRIAAIYEGANGIHAVALATRMLRLKDGRVAELFYDFVAKTVSQTGSSEALREGLALWQAFRERVLGSGTPEDLAHGFMKLTGLLTYMAVWQKIESVADRSNRPAHIEMLAKEVRHSALQEIKYWASL